MTASYDIADLSALDFNTVRFLLGDTDVSGTNAQLQDEEITFALSMRGNIYGATAFCAQALAAKYSRLVSMSADGVSVQYAAKAAAFKAVEREYTEKESMRYSTPYAGGVSIADMRGILGNTDRVPDIFRFGMFDNPPTDGVDPEPGTADLYSGDPAIGIP